jgi:hypothetical protein
MAVKDNQEETQEIQEETLEEILEILETQEMIQEKTCKEVHLKEMPRA